MSTRAVAPMKPVAAPVRTLTHAPSALLQRKCDCGASATHAGEGECEDCKKKKVQRRAIAPGPASAPPIVHQALRSPGQPLDEQTRSFFEPRFGHDFSKVRVHTDAQAHESARSVNALAFTVGHDLVFGAGHFAPSTKSGQRLLAHELTHVVQQSQTRIPSIQRKLEVGPANDTLEQEADRFAEQLTSESRVTAGWPTPPPSNGTRSRLQRAVADSSADQSAPAAATAPAPAGLIVEDEAANVAPGQMRKSEFLDGLRASVCATADSVLVAMGQTAQGCPLIERWIAKLRTRSSQHVERAIRKYAPESAGVSRAQDYFAAVGERVRQGVSRWAKTGEISGVPPELMSEMMGGGILGAIGGALSSIGGALSGAVSGIGKLFTKAKAGGARDANPAAIQARLGAGTTLDGGTKARMETAFGHNFSQVRVHADSSAAELSASLNARAFTIGRDVAFSAGDYRPGTLIGDALIAHELAHVVQQRDGTSSAAPMAKGGTEYNALEEDADLSAVGAMASLWGGAKTGLRNIRTNAIPRLRSGLRLQRCGSSRPPVQAPIQQSQPAPAPTPTNPACPPTLQNPRWEVSSDMVLGPTGSGCHLYLGTRSIPAPGSPAGLNGMGFTANLDIAPNCQGSVYFVQNVRVHKRALFGCVNSNPRGLCAQTPWGIDTQWPYGFGSNVATNSAQATAVPIDTHDAPGFRDISGGGFIKVCLEDEFVTYIVYEDPSHALTPLGWMHWNYSASAWRDQGTCPPITTSLDCRGWRVVGGGAKLADDFRPGSMGPQPLDRSLAVINPGVIAASATDCPDSSCTSPQASAPPAPAPRQPPPIQPKLEVGAVNDPLEQEADRFAEAITSGGPIAGDSPVPPRSNEAESRVQRAVASPVGEQLSPAATTSSVATLIVEDDATTIAPGQMRKSEFLEGLRASVCATADSELAAVGRTAQGCPFIERWIARLHTRTSQYIERAIRKYAPESASASAAHDYFAAVSDHVRQGVSRWASTGDLSGVPPELMSEMAGGGILGAIGGVVSSVVGAIGSAVSGIGKLFTKAKAGGAREANPVAMQAKLGAGNALDGGVKARMETAFGHDFSRVRMHADSGAAELSASVNARAFTIGHDVAFAAGEYRPGTVIGDALIAHELAHVMQQGDGVASAAPMAKGATEYNSLEEDADLSAVGAMVSLWAGTKAALKSLGANAAPRLRSGLRLQRCGGATPPVQAVKAEPTNIKWDANTACAGLQTEIGALLGQALATVRQALDVLTSPNNVADKLMKNFKLPADDPRVDRVKQVLQGAIESMDATAKGASETASKGIAPGLNCKPCKSDVNAETPYACGSSPAAPLVIQLCVTDGKLASSNPLRTMIHEFIHASCGRTKEVVGSMKYLKEGTGVTIASGDGEVKYQTPQKEIDENLKSAYAYAQFVLDVTGQ